MSRSLRLTAKEIAIMVDLLYYSQHMSSSTLGGWRLENRQKLKEKLLALLDTMTAEINIDETPLENGVYR